MGGKMSLENFCENWQVGVGIILVYNENGDKILEHYSKNGGFNCEWISAEYAMKKLK